MTDSNTIVISGVLDRNAEIVQYLAEPIQLGSNELFQIAIKRVYFGSCAFVEKNKSIGDVVIHYPQEEDAIDEDVWPLPMRISYMDGLSCLQNIIDNLPPDVRDSVKAEQHGNRLSLECTDGIKLGLPFDIG